MPDEQQLLAFAADFNTLPLETRWLLRGIQLGMKLSTEVEHSKMEEAIRCGLYTHPEGETSNSPACAGNHGAY